MANPDRLSSLDSTFLHLEARGHAHMHIGSIMVYEGSAPKVEELIQSVNAHLHLVPRYRQRLATVPFGQGRPVWVDDPHFNPLYHIRHTALPQPADEEALRRLAGRLFAQRLDRSRPLWEIWMVDRLSGDRFALITKNHHAVVDGISGVDIMTVLFDQSPDPGPIPPPPEPWAPRPLPSGVKLLTDALLERATIPAEMERGVRALLRTPRKILNEVREDVAGLGATAVAGVRAQAPPSPFNVDIGPHRRYTWVDAELDDFKAIKNALGGTINDVVLATVTLALGEYLRGRGHDTEGLVLKAMVPVSVRADADRGALGNRVAAMWAPLPVGITDPGECFAAVHEAMIHLKESNQTVGAQVLTSLAGFAGPTILSQAARLQARQRLFNLVVTNVPGPQSPIYLLGRRMTAFYPVVPLAARQALGIAIMSYDGHLGFGLLGDYDALPDIELIAAELERAIEALARAAGTTRRTVAPRSAAAKQRVSPSTSRPAAST